MEASRLRNAEPLVAIADELPPGIQPHMGTRMCLRSGVPSHSTSRPLHFRSIPRRQHLSIDKLSVETSGRRPVPAG